MVSDKLNLAHKRAYPGSWPPQLVVALCVHAPKVQRSATSRGHHLHAIAMEGRTGAMHTIKKGMNERTATILWCPFVHPSRSSLVRMEQGC